MFRLNADEVDKLLIGSIGKLPVRETWGFPGNALSITV